MSEEAFQVSGRNEYRYLVQDENEVEVQYARHRHYVSPLLVLSRRCIALICVGVLALLVLAMYLGYMAKTLPPASRWSPPPFLYPFQKNGAYSFKGLRYAAAPVGPLRWAPPVAPACNSDAVHDSMHFGSVCAQVQPLSASGTILGHEDCLFLNVWTPSLRPAAPLPVMVWVHGGYLHELSGGEPGYSPTERLAADTGVVYVSFNYRLNAFGFMALETLRDGSPTNTSGNYGFMDQILALQWVKKNIRLFGGDPNRVTIFGQSSGGTSVWTMMMSPLAKGLFSAAVDMSGSYVYKATLREAERDNLVFLNTTGCKDTPCLRSLSVQQVLQAIPWQKYPGWAYDDGCELPTRGLLPGPVAVVDGYVLPDAPFSMWDKGGGDYSDVPFVIGTTEQEGDFDPSASNISDWTWDDYTWFVTEKLSTFNESLPQQALKLYPSSAFCPTTTRCPERAYTTMASDIRVSCPNHDLAKRAAAALHSPVYRYVVTHTPSRAITPWGLLTFPSRFSFHSLDAFAFFQGLEPLLGAPLPKQDQHFQDLITQHLVHFAKNGKMEDVWPEFPSSLALLSENLTVVQTDSEVVSRCELWERNGLYAYAWVN
uniref:Carboxylic ester hydrolase n=1 Tax=Neogobius melanostomus TaxID=47308 RepID=A0A8C6S287_9GOBI